MSSATGSEGLAPRDGDALIVVDMQRDFVPPGNLGVPEGDQAVQVMNRYIELFRSRGLPVVATRDWHTADHCSFHEQGGPWPPHCIAETPGAAFADGLHLPDDVIVISKGTARDKDAYSGFEGTELVRILEAHNVRRLYVGGLATDVCVLNTVRDAVRHGLEVVFLKDASRAVNVEPGDGERAEEEMARLGARTARYTTLAA